MARIRRLLFALILFGSPAQAGRAAPATGEEHSEPFSLSFLADLASTYYWRGFNVTDRHWVIQPEVQAAHNPTGIWFNFWASHTVEGRLETGEADEVDLTLGWMRSWGRHVAAGVGGIVYVYPRLPGDEGRSRELFANLKFIDLPMTPGLTYFHDFDLGRGGYLQLTGLQEFGKFELGLESGVNFEQYTGKSGLSDLSARFAWNWELGDSGWLSPYVRMAWIRDPERNPDEAMVWIGVNLGWER